MLSDLNAIADETYRINVNAGFEDEALDLHAPFITADEDAEFDQKDVRNLRNFQIAKLALIIGEASEAIEELRKGKPVTETYYETSLTPLEILTSDKVQKPEGVPSELADIIIRTINFARSEGIDIVAAINEKAAYNATRARMHGDKVV